MQRPQATEAPDRERADVFQSLKTIGVTVGNDEAAQDEKEIHEKICVPDKIQGIDRAEDVQVK